MDVMLDAAPEAELPAILTAVSRELSALGDMGSELQGVLSLLAHAHGKLDHVADEDGRAPGSEEIQALDLFTQRLFVLADFLMALAPTLPPDCRADLKRALQVVTLADVARRLSSADPLDEEPVDTGALELFGDMP